MRAYEAHGTNKSENLEDAPQTASCVSGTAGSNVCATMPRVWQFMANGCVGNKFDEYDVPIGKHAR